MGMSVPFLQDCIEAAFILESWIGLDAHLPNHLSFYTEDQDDHHHQMMSSSNRGYIVTE